MKTLTSKLRRGLVHTLIAGMVLAPLPTLASSHQDAPLIILDPAANTTDVYAFVDEDNGQKNLVVALGVYPHENAGVGPNKYGFDDNVRYEINLSLGNNVAAGLPSIIYRFEFKTSFKRTDTILQAYTGVVQNIDDTSQNLTQRYTVTKIDLRNGTDRVLGQGIVPPNNEGNATPFYNQGNNGENPARKGVATEAELDKYTSQAITQLSSGYESFAGQRDDGFYADIQSIFDLLKLRNPGKDSQGGFNIHFMALEIPVSELGGDSQVIGVYATTSRPAVPVVNPSRGFPNNIQQRQFVQVARKGNPPL